MPEYKMQNLSAEEAPLYQKLFMLSDTNKTGRVDSQSAVGLFRKSGLEDKALGEIWRLVTPNNESFLDESRFIASMRLIAKKQSRKVARFEGISVPTGDEKYREGFKKLAGGESVLTKPQAMELLARTNFPKDQLSKVWDLIDPNNTGQMTEDQCVASMLLITEGFKSGLPEQLPSPLKKYIPVEDAVMVVKSSKIDISEPPKDDALIAFLKQMIESDTQELEKFRMKNQILDRFLQELRNSIDETAVKVEQLKGKPLKIGDEINKLNDQLQLQRREIHNEHERTQAITATHTRLQQELKVLKETQEEEIMKLKAKIETEVKNPHIENPFDSSSSDDPKEFADGNPFNFGQNEPMSQGRTSVEYRQSYGNGSMDVYNFTNSFDFRRQRSESQFEKT